MGFYTKYFSTLLKGIRITTLKERIEIRRLINNLRKADNILYKSLFEDVEKEHRVTRAINEEEKLIRELKKSAENAYSLCFNLSTEEMQLLKIIEDILKELESFSGVVGSDPQLKNLERELALTIFEALKNAEMQERSEFKQILLIINEAEEKNRNNFMANIRLAFQKETQQTMLAKFAARSEIRKIKVDVLKLEEIPLLIKALRVGVAGKKKEIAGKVINELSGAIREIKKYCSEAFTELFIIQKRITLLTLKILIDLNNLKAFNEKWKGKKFMPEKPLKEKEGDIDKIESAIAKDFHIIAQAFRIIINKIQNLEGKSRKSSY